MALSGFNLISLEPEVPPNHRLMVVLCPSIAAIFVCSIAT